MTGTLGGVRFSTKPLGFFHLRESGHAVSYHFFVYFHLATHIMWSHFPSRHDSIGKRRRGICVARYQDRGDSMFFNKDMALGRAIHPLMRTQKGDTLISRVAREGSDHLAAKEGVDAQACTIMTYRRLAGNIENFNIFVFPASALSTGNTVWPEKGSSSRGWDASGDGKTRRELVIMGMILAALLQGCALK